MQEDVNVLRDVIRQLRDELHRMKANQDQTGQTGAYATGWSARRSLNLLRFSLNRPMMLPHVDDDSDEEMEIVDTDDTMPTIREETCVLSPGQGSEDADVNMEDEVFETCDKDKSTALNNGIIGHTEISLERKSETPPEKGLGEKTEVGELTPIVCEKLLDNNLSMEPVGQCPSLKLLADTENTYDKPTKCIEDAAASDLGIIPIDLPPVLKSPTPSVSPRVTNSRKSLRTSSTITASQSYPTQCNLNAANASTAKPTNSILLSSRSIRKSCFTSTEKLAATLNHGLEIIQSQRLTPSMRRSSFRFSCMPADFKAVIPVVKVDVGVQTLSPDEKSVDKNTGEFLCSKCKTRNCEQVLAVNDDDVQNMQLVPINDGTSSHETCTNLVPKVSQLLIGGSFTSFSFSISYICCLIILQAVEKVLAGAIRREMALEEMCAKQNSEIMHLNRLVCKVIRNALVESQLNMIQISNLHFYRSSNTNMRESAMPLLVKLVKIKLLGLRA